MTDPFDLDRFATAQEPVFDSVIGDNGARGELRYALRHDCLMETGITGILKR